MFYKINNKFKKGDQNTYKSPNYFSDDFYYGLYNWFMFEAINVILISFVSDLIICLCLKRFFDLQIKFFEILFLQIIMIAPAVVYVFCDATLLMLLVLKLVAGLLLTVLITDSYRWGFLWKLYMCYVAMMFSVYGCAEFMLLLGCACIKTVTGTDLPEYLHGVLLIAVLVYVTLIFVLVRKWVNYKNLKPYLANVSFMLLGKHIEMVGLIDSGNSLIDSKTNKPVVVVSSSIIKKHFNSLDVKFDGKNDLCKRFIECVAVGGISFKMPIIDVESVTITTNNTAKRFDCVIGVVNQEFCDAKNYQCLIHRNFC